MLISPQSLVEEHLESLLSTMGRARKSADMSRYEDDPSGFVRDVLGEQLTDDLERICESVRSNAITIAQSCNASGKSFLSARLAIWFYLCHREVQVYTLAAPPEDNLRRILWGEIGSLYIRHRDELFGGSKQSGLMISRSPLDFIAGVTIPSSGTREERVAKVSGKHRDNLLFLLDEADAIPDEIYEGVETCVSGGSKVRILCMFNPRKSSGKIYRMIKNKTASVVQLSAFNHPNVIEGHDVIPGAVTRERTVYRINEYCRHLPDDETPSKHCFRLPRFLCGARAKRNDAGETYPPLRPGWYEPVESSFAYMVLGQYPAQSSTQLISDDWISAAQERWKAWVDEHGLKPPAKTWAVMGVDIAEFGDDSTVEWLRWGPWLQPAKVWRNIDTDETALRCVDDYRRHKMLKACIDATGVGASVAPHMARKGCIAYGVKVASSPTKTADLGEFKIVRDQLAWDLREWLRTDEHCMIPPDTMLEEELLAVEYEIKNGKIEITKSDKLKEALGRSPDRLWALAMTFYEPVPLFSAWAGKGRR